MIFDGKSIADISDEEIVRLVAEHQEERQHLEFKLTVNYRDDKDRLEILRDIVSMANGGGGYLIVGIRDDGKGKAQRFEPESVGDVNRIFRAVGDLCRDHISERIEGLEVVARTVAGNPVVIVRVPDSARRPHMVTYKNRTDFWARCHDGKREMTIGEIRQAFSEDWLGIQVSRMSEDLSVLTREIRNSGNVDRVRRLVAEGNENAVLDLTDGKDLLETRYELFKSRTGTESRFFMAACPLELRGRAEFPDDVREILRTPPGSRPTAWSMHWDQKKIIHTANGLHWGRPGIEEAELLFNGLLEMRIDIAERFFHRQNPEEIRTKPRLYPYPVVEYPATFLRLYGALAQQLDSRGDSIVWMVYRNIAGHYLRPGAPGSIDFDFPVKDPRPMEKETLFFSATFDPTETTDEVAFSLVKQLYAAFGLRESAVPFFNRSTRRFSFS